MPFGAACVFWNRLAWRGLFAGDEAGTAKSEEKIVLIEEIERDLGYTVAQIKRRGRRETKRDDGNVDAGLGLRRRFGRRMFLVFGTGGGSCVRSRQKRVLS
jgi:hypothetical protein